MKNEVAVDIKGRIAVLMGDGRERTVNEIALKLSAQRAAVALAAERMLDMELLKSERVSGILTYKARPAAEMSDRQMEKILLSIPFRHRKTA